MVFSLTFLSMYDEPAVLLARVEGSQIKIWFDAVLLFIIPAAVTGSKMSDMHWRAKAKRNKMNRTYSKFAMRYCPKMMPWAMLGMATVNLAGVLPYGQVSVMLLGPGLLLFGSCLLIFVVGLFCNLASVMWKTSPAAVDKEYENSIGVIVVILFIIVLCCCSLVYDSRHRQNYSSILMIGMFVVGAFVSCVAVRLMTVSSPARSIRSGTAKCLTVLYVMFLGCAFIEMLEDKRMDWFVWVTGLALTMESVISLFACHDLSAAESRDSPADIVWFDKSVPYLLFGVVFSMVMLFIPMKTGGGGENVFPSSFIMGHRTIYGLYLE